MRVSAGIGALWGAATLTFIVINLTGGDTAVAILGGPDALPTEQVLHQVRTEYGLDKPLTEQYVRYLWQLLQGDLGESYTLRIPVVKAIGQQLAATTQLSLCAAVLALAVSIPSAVLTAKRKAWIVSLASGLELVLSSTPSFVLGTLLLLLFSFQLHILPATGTEGWPSLVLPALTLGLPVSALLAQVLRRELDDILEQPFIVMARARGMSDADVRLGRALGHAMIPLVTMSGLLFASFVGLAVVVETLFARQGVGRLLVDATTNKDVPLVLGITLLCAAIYVSVSLVVDLFYLVIDPRVRAS